MNSKMPLYLFTLIIIFQACTSNDGFDRQKEIKAIKSLLQQERKAHFERNTELFMSEFADSMISVNKGKVSVATPEENKKRIRAYFGSVEFIKWDDVAEPIIRLADDGSLAYAVVQKQVILSRTDSLGKPFIDTTGYAWVSVYRKQKGEWKVECNASTNK
ncbi:MAG TPA: hypothetical protein VJU78_16305 [Chitinophagaceae bacterium]|nr:hypothetical protein [Chitinophagaceae bacterium]